MLHFTLLQYKIVSRDCYTTPSSSTSFLLSPPNIPGFLSNFDVVSPSTSPSASPLQSSSVSQSQLLLLKRCLPILSILFNSTISLRKVHLPSSPLVRDFFGSISRVFHPFIPVPGLKKSLIFSRPINVDNFICLLARFYFSISTRFTFFRFD